MHSFKDRHGKNWNLELNIGMARKIKSQTQYDLIDLSDEKDLLRLSVDLYLLADVLYILCEEQCKEVNLSSEKFGEVFSGQSIQDAVNALMEEMSDFFRSPLMRELLQKTVKKINQGEAAVLGEALKDVEKMDVEKEAREAYRKQKEKIKKKTEQKKQSVSNR